MPKIAKLMELPDGRLGITLDMPDTDEGELTIWTAAERDRAIRSAVLAEREECAKLAVGKSQLHGDCDYRGMQDPETGEVPCDRRDGCLCDDLAEHGDAIAKAICEQKP